MADAIDRASEKKIKIALSARSCPMSSMSTLLVLAAGMGSRYGGLKQIDPMGPNGEAVLDYSIFDAIRAGFDRVIFVIREDFADAFRDGIGRRFSDRIHVEYAFQRLNDLPAPYVPAPERSKPWGTAHAIRAARHLINGPFAVVNADDFYGRDAYQKAIEFFKTGPSADCALVGYPLQNTLSDHGQVNRGICGLGSGGLLASVEEYLNILRGADGTITGQALDGTRREIPGDALVSMNFWILPGGFLEALETEFLEFLAKNAHLPTGECYIPTVVDQLIRKGGTNCHVLQTSARWFGVTYPDDKAHVVASVNELISQGEYPSGSLR